MATMGERSIMPMRGMTRRKGAKIGSVMSCRKITIGLPGSGWIHDMIARAKIATVRTSVSIWTKRATASIFP